MSYTTLDKLDIVLSDRLVLRKFTVGDANDVFEYASDKTDANRYMAWQPHAEVADSIKYIKEYAIPRDCFCIEYSGKCIGCIELRPLDNGKYSFGYIINKKFWNLGFASEALYVMLDAMFNRLGATEIIGRHAVSNRASGRVMEKNGFKVDRIIPDGAPIRGGKEDMRMMYLTRKDYFELMDKKRRK